MGEIRVGISGWSYRSWRGDFYPAGLRQRDELRYSAERLDTIEVNGSFYSLQRPSTYQAWVAAVPDGFVFAVKGSRYVTHMKRLRDAGTGLANFFASGVLALGPKLGPMLWQLPARMTFDADRIATFLDQLPGTTRAAAHLARRHDGRLKAEAWTRPGRDRRVRHVLEVRHESFRDPAFVALLRERQVGLVVTHGGADWPLLEAVTSDVMYVRLHGAPDLYASGYGASSLAEWAAKARRWARSADVFVYFDNDARGRAPHDAQELRRIIASGEA